MRLVRYGDKGREAPGLLDEGGRLRDLSGEVDDIAGDVLSDEGLRRLAALDPALLPPVDGYPRLGPCIGRVGKILCIGLNYADHAAETGSALPQEPIVFGKATSALCGPTDDLELPPTSERVDWEVELAVVIGRAAKYLSEDDAMAHVAGYALFNDVSERNFQARRSGQWIKGKSADTFAPLGPWFVPKADIPDPHDLAMFTDVNERRFQDGSTRTMHVRIPALVAHVTEFMSLQPGDIIATGTPPGVGLGQKPPVFLKEGDEVRVGIEGLGEQRQRVVRAPV